MNAVNWYFLNASNMSAGTYRGMGDHSCGHPCGQQQCNRQTEHMEQRQQGQKHMFLFRGLLNDRHQLGKVGQ